ncbi:MAG TPA: nucleotidyltransferase domain-containing protein [Solirubrobacteraceae bacterium]|nr:nucleotidyltransferase domain-containing protein [Solirubrobacteraceae bacterium]
MRTAAPRILPLFRSELQARLLAVLLLGDDEPQSTSRLAALTDASAASLNRELRRLEDAGIIEHERVGRSKLYRAAAGSPVHAPLRELLARTLGVEPLLRERLAAVPGVAAAALFGSWAAGRIGPASDIDLLVVGDVDRDRLLREVREVERVVGREINLTAYRPDEFARRRRERSGFLATVLARPLTPLVGDLGTP